MRHDKIQEKSRDKGKQKQIETDPYTIQILEFSEYLKFMVNMSRKQRKRQGSAGDTQNPSKWSNRNMRTDKYKTETNNVLEGCNNRSKTAVQRTSELEDMSSEKIHTYA